MIFFILFAVFLCSHVSVNAVPEGNFLIPGKMVKEMIEHLVKNEQMPDSFSLHDFKLNNEMVHLKKSEHRLVGIINYDVEENMKIIFDGIKDSLENLNDYKKNIEKVDFNILVQCTSNQASYTLIISETNQKCYFSFDNEDFLLHATLILVPLLMLVAHWNTLANVFDYYQN